MINIILQQAESVIQDAIQGADFSHEEQISFDIFPEASDSSLATPVCFEIANQHGLNPQVVATEIVENVELDEPFDSKEFLREECDLMISEVSAASTGLGIELG